MADEERTPEDIRIVRDIAGSADDFSRPLTRLNMYSFRPPETESRFDVLVTRVEQAVTGGRAFLTDERRQQLSQSFAAGLRVFGFYDRLDLPYALALRGMENAYEATVIVDLFRPNALRSLLGPRRRRRADLPPDAETLQPPPPFDPRTWTDFRPLVGRLEAEDNEVQRVPLEVASRNYTTLFVDTLRGLAGGVRRVFGAAAPPTTIQFTVHSGPGNAGYALAAFPQHRYTPASFGGSKLSTPVNDQLATGHWCFEGVPAGSAAAPVRDRWPHFVGPNNTSTKTTLF